MHRLERSRVSGRVQRSPLVRIETPAELRSAWVPIARALRSQVGGASRLDADPEGTLAGLGYEVVAEAATLLLAALRLSR